MTAALKLKCCSGCLEAVPLSGFNARQNYCRSCQRAYIKVWRKENRAHVLDYGRRNHTPANPEYQREYQRRRQHTPKVLARQLANVHFKGRKFKCADCGTFKHVDKAHLDYDYPLVVVPLCRIHHKQFDSDPVYYEKMRGFAVCA